MLTFAYCFFSTWCWKNTGILWVHPNLVGNMAVFVARFGCPITTPNLLHFGLKFLFWKLSEDVRTRCCQRIWTTLHNQKPKYAIEQKKRPLRVKPIMDKKNVHTVFQVYIYTCVFNNVDFRIASSALVSALSRSPGGAGARERRRIASQTHQCRGHGCSWCEKISKIDDNHGNYCDKFHI